MKFGNAALMERHWQGEAEVLERNLLDCQIVQQKFVGSTSWRVTSNQRNPRVEGSHVFRVRLEPVRIPVRNDPCHSCLLRDVKLNIFEIFWSFSKSKFLMELFIHFDVSVRDGVAGSHRSTTPQRGVGSRDVIRRKSSRLIHTASISRPVHKRSHSAISPYFH